jgi:signal transduction histidine kinase
MEETSKAGLVNLITNALCYTSSGGTITIKATTGYREVCLMVADTGKGILFHPLGWY